MRLSHQKIAVIFQLKLLAILKNFSIMVAPVTALSFVLLFKTIVPLEPAEAGVSTPAFILGFSLTFNIVMSGLMMTSQPLAEEKENQTLRVLLSSSVTHGDFLIGSALPAFLLTTLVNLGLVPLAGTSFQTLSLLPFLMLTSFASLISILFGLAVGIYAKNQIQASIISFPIIMVLTMIPIFTAFSPDFDRLSHLFYSGILIHYINQILLVGHYSWSLTEVALAFIWLALAGGCLRYTYLRNRQIYAE